MRTSLVDDMFTPFTDDEGNATWDAILKSSQAVEGLASGVLEQAAYSQDGYAPRDDPFGAQARQLQERAQDRAAPVDSLVGSLSARQAQRLDVSRVLEPLAAPAPLRASFDIGGQPYLPEEYVPQGGVPQAAAPQGNSYIPDASRGLTGDRFFDKTAEAAAALQIPVEDLLTIMRYETGGTLDPLQPGGVTKWGRHRGLIQFGEQQARDYGVDWQNPIDSQLGADGAIVKYFRARGWKPGMSYLDAYAIVNGGSPGGYNRTDEHVGGAPGSILDKVNSRQMAQHRELVRQRYGQYYGEGI